MARWSWVWFDDVIFGLRTELKIGQYLNKKNKENPIAKSTPSNESKMVQYVCGPIGLKNNLAYSRACKPGQMVDGKTTRGPRKRMLDYTSFLHLMACHSTPKIKRWKCYWFWRSCVTLALHVTYNNYSMSPSWIWSDKITNERVARVGYNHVISNKGEWNNSQTGFCRRFLFPQFYKTSGKRTWRTIFHMT